MSEQEQEEQVSSEETLNDETGEDTSTPDDTQRKKTNKSNWKEMSEAKKEAERKLAEAQEELTAWRSENPDLVASTLSKKSDGIDKGDLALFLVQNPDAKEHLDDVKEYLVEMKNPDLEKAWKYVKPTLKVESQTTRDFDISNRKRSEKIDFKTLTMTEAYEEGRLTAEQRSEWRKANTKE